uniref:SLC3A2_N domain-containing protein n=1 Tax=Bursaphelenchus xylophilus TaxID=6326 RepID=A0A1I7SJ56_BURXY
IPILSIGARKKSESDPGKCGDEESVSIAIPLSSNAPRQREMSAFRFSTRRKLGPRNLALLSAVAFAFFLLWFLLTVLIIYAEDWLLGPTENVVRQKMKENGGGVKLVVGHYNGNLPKERLANLTQGELEFEMENNVSLSGK